MDIKTPNEKSTGLTNVPSPENSMLVRMGFLKIDHLEGTEEYQARGGDKAVKGLVRMQFQAIPEMCHSGGTIVQGGYVTGWIDSAMAHTMLYQSNFKVNPLTLEIKTSFLEATGPGVVYAEAWIVRRGRKIAFCEGRLLNENGDVTAVANSTVRLVDMAHYTQT